LIAVFLAVTALASAAIDPCAPVVPAPDADPVSAATYRAVGDEERLAGHPDAAAVAFRAAAERDPGDAAARRALAELCQATRPDVPPGHFERGLALMQGGDFRGAAGEFDEALDRVADASTALLAGVCRYRLGDTARAGVLLRQAEADPDHAAVARYYLGLLAIAEGRFREASILLDQAAAGPELAPLARDLARLAWRNQRLVFTAFTAVGWDSNATLAPGGTPLASASDGAFDLGAAAIYRPHGDSGPYLRASGALREQFQVDSLDMLGASAGAGWQLGRLGNALVLGYDYDFRTLGGAPYLSASRLGASGWLAAGPAVLTASYFARWEAYLPAAYQPFDGTVQHASLKAAFVLGQASWLTVGYGLTSDSVQVDYLSWLEHGPRAVLRWLVAPRWRLGFEAGVAFRAYAAVAPALGVRREDLYLDGAAVAEYDPDLQWTIWLSLDARRALSNVSQYDYSRIAPTLGVSFATGK
jgi:tetratricopeptide (TPR) repeat protein